MSSRMMEREGDRGNGEGGEGEAGYGGYGRGRRWKGKEMERQAGKGEAVIEGASSASSAMQ